MVWISDLLTQFRWQDILDIALVSIIIYKILFLIKGTRAAKMLMGIVILLLASFFSRYFQIYTMDWLIQSFWAQVVIVIVILFQPEIRKALAHIGAPSFFHNFTSAEEIKSLEEILKSVMSLSNKKIGALIVIEREVNLKDYIEIGVQLDAKISRELLLSVFHPTSKIHDGAVIIKGNRVIAAGCFLPIRLDVSADKDLGTRHRAGICITEETDAISIIISEETGNISCSIDGKIETFTDISDLREFFTKLFTMDKKNPTTKKSKKRK